MAIYIVSEPEFRNSTWCSSVVSGINERARKKRVKVDTIDDTTEGYSLACKNDIIAFIGATPSWIRGSVLRAKQNCDAFLVTVGSSPYDVNINRVGTDRRASMLSVLEYLRKLGRKRIALYGFNKTSGEDLMKLEAFDGDKVFENNGNLSRCFDDFFPEVNDFDAVICTNDYAAVSLIDNIKSRCSEKLDELYIVSFADTLLSKMYNPSITSVSLDFFEYGVAVVDVYSMLLKCKSISTLSVDIKSTIIPRQTTGGNEICCDDKQGDYFTEDISCFYGDKEVQSMIKVERLIEGCTDTDFAILKAVFEGKSIEETADDLYLSSSGVKYRLKRLLEVSKIDNRQELVMLLNRYIRL